ncbi:MAG: tetratricopeptide repeat protein [Gemmataceae bacterium]
MRWLFLLSVALLGPVLSADNLPTNKAAADKAFQAGQKAMDADLFDEAIGQFQLALRLQPDHAQALLGLAATYLALGRDPDAVNPLRHYLRLHPDHFLIRWHLAEVLLRLAQPTEARQQFERYLITVQNRPHLEDDPVLRAHTRLMELARLQGDTYAEHLHRGIGLLLLAERKGELKETVKDPRELQRSIEELLCKSAAELSLARLERPQEARPAWYLHRVWLALGQRQAAERWLRVAQRLATPGTLTPAERAALDLAQSEHFDPIRRR